MNSKTLIDLLTNGGAQLQDITDNLQVVHMLLGRTNQYEEILNLIQKIELDEFPKIKEFVSLVHSAGMLNSSGITSLVRECMGRSNELIVHTADPDLISITDANTILQSSKVGLEIHQGQRVYKRSLESDVSKLLK